MCKNFENESKRIEKKNTFMVPIKGIHNFCAADGICAKEVVEHNNKKQKSELKNKSV